MKGFWKKFLWYNQMLFASGLTSPRMTVFWKQHPVIYKAVLYCQALVRW